MTNNHRIVPCYEWGAKPPKQPIQVAGHYDKSLFHHTAGHHPELDKKPTESYAEAVSYVRSIQKLHMGPQRGWNDTGQNFTVTRSGHIFEGRHRSLELLSRGMCPVSAHCPNQNGNPGVEIEHIDPEPMTPAQYDSAVWLFALICKNGKLRAKTIKGHRDFFATACPSSLYGQLPQFRKDVAKELGIVHQMAPWWTYWHPFGH